MYNILNVYCQRRPAYKNEETKEEMFFFLTKIFLLVLNVGLRI